MAAEVSLLRAVGNCPNHVLRSIFPPIVEKAFDLRPRLHEYQWSERDDRNFMNRVLFRLLRSEPRLQMHTQVSGQFLKN